ncbi:NAD(P)/FAD-dependent oxidoreductase [Streptomyces sp. NPDC001982]|uniref:flavin-containing monooxygenase n=1 Tax=Streptomyces sp. NPDC001982 TaxID=3154405 RepID=UPI00331C2BA7
MFFYQRSIPGREPTVAIIGAGFGGIAMAAYLKRSNLTKFTVYERSGRAGGTWWDNQFPGAACDVESRLYSLSFSPGDWRSSYADQADIQHYMEQVINNEGLRDHFSFENAVAAVRWNHELECWTVETERGDCVNFDVVVSALGMLNNPAYPEWTGLDEFGGVSFHTARWEHGRDLSNARVGVVGTGATAAQVVPRLAETCKELVVFQREPAWVAPKPTRNYTPFERAVSKRRWLSRLQRAAIFLRTELRILSAKPGSRGHARAERELRSYLTSAVPDAKLRDALSPDYPFRCKRVVRSSEFYPALMRSNVSLVPFAVSSATRGGVVDTTGHHHPLDALVFATGFKASEFLATLPVHGPAGRTIQQEWDGDARALLGITYPGFPNFFMLYGPNTNPATASALFHIECQARYVARAVRQIARLRGGRLQARTSVLERYDSWLMNALGKTALAGSCNSYYRGASGRILTNWPHTSSLYWMLTRLPLFLTLKVERAGVGSATRGVALDVLENKSANEGELVARPGGGDLEG